MEPRISIITLGVQDLDRARAFYTALGLTVALFVAGCGGDQNPYPRRTLDLAKPFWQ